jgi:hypothetical protein
MSDEQKTTQEQCCAPSEGVPSSTMMEKMMGQQGQSCSCIEMMSQLMGARCGPQVETGTGTQTA